MLSGFFHRPITAEAFEDGSPDSWFLGLDAAISMEELRMLLKSLPMDDSIEDASNHEDDPVWGFSQDLSEKVIAQMVPYRVVESKCSDSGLWLICGDFIGILVDQDEQLGKDMEEFQSKEDIGGRHS